MKGKSCVRKKAADLLFFFNFSIIFILAIAHKVYRLKIDDGRKKNEEEKKLVSLGSLHEA